MADMEYVVAMNMQTRYEPYLLTGGGDA